MKKHSVTLSLAVALLIVLSSVNPVAAAVNSAGVHEDGCVLYEHINGDGIQFSAINRSWNYVGGRFNDRASLLYVAPGYEVVLYVDRDFTGSSMSFKGGRRGKYYDLHTYSWHDRVSSFKLRRLN